jgi:hypothetical protein
MAFDLVVKGHTGGARRAYTQVTMRASLHDGKIGKHIGFRFPRSILAELGWKTGDRISVNEGVGNDAGFLMFKLDPKGYGIYTPNDETGSGSIHVMCTRFQSYALNECPAPSTIVEHTTDDGALIIQTPDWLRYFDKDAKVAVNG